MRVLLFAGALALRLAPNPVLTRNVAGDSAGMTADDAELLEEMEVEAMARRALPSIRSGASTRMSRIREEKIADHSLTAPRVLVVGTHHKTGTVLVRKLLEELTRSLDSANKTVLFHREVNSASPYQFKGVPRIHNRGWANNEGIQIIQYQNTIKADFSELERRFGVDGFRYVQVARDPVSLVISAYLYHMHSDDCYNACPKNSFDQGLFSMRRAPLTVGLKMQADAAMDTTLKEQREVSESICKDASSDQKIMLLSDFAEKYDDAVDDLYTFLAGDLADRKVLADAKVKAEAHDVNRWSSARLSSNKHVSGDDKKDSIASLWSNLTDTQLDPERAKVNQQRTQYSEMIESCRSFTQH